VLWIPDSPDRTSITSFQFRPWLCWGFLLLKLEEKYRFSGGAWRMNVFGIGLPEMALIFVLALLVFGPKKLPEIGKSVGKALRGFQEASNEFQNEFKKEAEVLETAFSQPTSQSMTAKLEETSPQQPSLSAAADDELAVKSAEVTVIEPLPIETAIDTPDKPIETASPSPEESA